MQNLTEKFINTQVVGRGLDGRTAKAYRIDLDLFFRWLESGRQENVEEEGLERKMEIYLKYLSENEGFALQQFAGSIRYSGTICHT